MNSSFVCHTRTRLCLKLLCLWTYCVAILARVDDKYNCSPTLSMSPLQDLAQVQCT